MVHPGEEIWLRIDPERRAVLAPVGTALPAVGFPPLPAACAALLEPEHAARAQAIYDECLVAAYDALAGDRLLERRDAVHAFRCALGRVPDHSGVALAIHALRAAGILRGYNISVTEDYDGVPVGGVAFDHLLTAERLAQPEAAAAGILAGMPGGSLCGAVAEMGASVLLDDTWHAVPAAGQALVRAWARSCAEPGQRLCAAPARHRDRRHRALHRSIPPAGLSVACELIACGSFRMIGDPAMNWARPLARDLDVDPQDILRQADLGAQELRRRAGGNPPGASEAVRQRMAALLPPSPVVDDPAAPTSTDDVRRCDALIVRLGGAATATVIAT